LLRESTSASHAGRAIRGFKSDTRKRGATEIGGAPFLSFIFENCEPVMLFVAEGLSGVGRRFAPTDRSYPLSGHSQGPSLGQALAKAEAEAKKLKLKTY
jgi:hypothetical protein